MRSVRKLMHAALAIVPLAGWLFEPWVALALAGLLGLGSLALEVARRSWPGIDRTLWGHAPGLFRPWEQQGILGSTWFVASMLGALLFFGQDVGGLVVLFLALGDPAAEIAGRRWGRPGVRKTWAGSVACLMVCLATATTVALLGFVHPVVAVAGAVAAAAAERWSPPPTDNIWMPLFSALVMAACHQLLIV